MLVIKSKNVPTIVLHKNGKMHILGKIDTSKLITTSTPSPFTGMPHVSVAK